tara:strand:+ start:1870 stop:2373 length:504 start_codon:yes stop_codon:yes gene_type:complete
MNKKKFQSILFDVACASMACDGRIDKSELDMLKDISENSTYFQGIDFSKKINEFKINAEKNLSKALDTIFESIKISKFDSIQELLILEVSLRIIYADVKIDPNEVDLVKKIRACLKIDDQYIIKRFGRIEFLIDKNYDFNSYKAISKSDYDKTSLENLYFHNSNDKK